MEICHLLLETIAVPEVITLSLHSFTERIGTRFVCEGRGARGAVEGILLWNAGVVVGTWHALGPDQIAASVENEMQI